MSAALPASLSFQLAINSCEQKNQAQPLINMGNLTKINIPPRKNTIFFRRSL
jgi:hypothetical protein